jgi:hypothetical protein
MARRGAARQARRGVARQGAARHGTAGVARQARLGLARQGTAGHGTEWQATMANERIDNPMTKYTEPKPPEYYCGDVRLTFSADVVVEIERRHEVLPGNEGTWARAAALAALNQGMRAARVHGITAEFE